jgi:hypothetical protein
MSATKILSTINGIIITLREKEPWNDISRSSRRADPGSSTPL